MSSFRPINQHFFKGGQNEILQLLVLIKCPYFFDVTSLETRAKILKKSLWVYWSKRWHQKDILKLTDLLWWSFENKGQLGEDFSSKISSRKAYFWFDFNWLSNGSSQIGHQFRKCSVSKIWSYKKLLITKNVLLNWLFEMKNQKDSDDIWYWKLTFKIRFRYLLM